MRLRLLNVDGFDIGVRMRRAQDLAMHHARQLYVISKACDAGYLGAAVHAAAWDEDVVDYVQLYVTPIALGAGGVPLLDGRSWSLSSLIDPRVEVLGPDTLIEGYVHRPH